MAVYKRGSFSEQRHDKARCILILGVGVLNDSSQNAFRAVLAHEYGHFTHRDTAGGDVALRINADMMKFAHAMAQSGQAVWWNIAFQFLRVYHFPFRRIISRNEPPATGAVWELFANRESLTNEMSALIDQRVQGTAF